MEYERSLSIVDQFLSEELSKELLKVAQRSDFYEIRQSKENHYSHVFSSLSTIIARPCEVYSARFLRSEALQLQRLLIDSFLPQIVNILKDKDGELRYFLEPVIHKLIPGCYYRTHVDDYAGRYGFTYFLNSHWMWDYGGILRFYDEMSYESTSIFPKHNTLLVRDESLRLFHDVSVVSEHAGTSQYLVIGWASRELPCNPKYNYIKF